MSSNIYKKKVLVREIKDFFKLTQITGDEKSLERWVVVPDTNRPGFELAGYFRLTEPRRVVIIGQKEIEYISHLNEAQQRERYPFITDGLTPMIVITRGNEVPPILKEIAQAQNFPIFVTQQDTAKFTVDLISFLDEQLAEEDTISGVLLVVFGVGVLLMGDSGIGKSETALGLIKDGHVLVADDRVDIQRIHNHIHGHAPELLKGKLEMRGIGVIDVQRMFGASCLKDRNRIEMVIHLVQYEHGQEYDRVGDTEDHFTKILGVEIPSIYLPVSSGRSTRVLVETAVTNFILREQGYNSAEQFKEDLRNYLMEENKKAEGKNE